MCKKNMNSAGEKRAEKDRIYEIDGKWN